MRDYLEPIEFARKLRLFSTSSERLLRQFLRNHGRCGKKFRRQHPLGSYTADFYCVEAKLVVEVDGATDDNANLTGLENGQAFKKTIKINT